MVGDNRLMDDIAAYDRIGTEVMGETEVDPDLGLSNAECASEVIEFFNLPELRLTTTFPDYTPDNVRFVCLSHYLRLRLFERASDRGIGPESTNSLMIATSLAMYEKGALMLTKSLRAH